MATEQDKQRYIDDMARRRGYVLDYHKVMAKHGFHAWREATGAAGIEPTLAVHDNGSGR
jgi:4-carboxymuconolactone decarboxylase